MAPVNGLCEQPVQHKNQTYLTIEYREAAVPYNYPHRGVVASINICQKCAKGGIIKLGRRPQYLEV